MSTKWTLEEDISLLTVARTHFPDLISAGRFNASSPLSKKMHADFVNCFRDPSALLYRLNKCGLLKYAGPIQDPQQQMFVCNLNNDIHLYDFSVCPNLLKKALNPTTITKLIRRYAEFGNILGTEMIIERIADELKLNPMLVTKVLVDEGLMWVDDYRNYVRSDGSSAGQTATLAEKIRLQTPPENILQKINMLREKASQLYHVHEREGAEVIFSSDGTGFGKSYGVIEGYVLYLERFAATQEPKADIPERGFTNLLFMSPQKAQFDLEAKQIERINAAGGEFICVLARKDIYDLDFVNWATGQTNRERYQQWFEGAKNSAYIGTAVKNLNYLMRQIDRCNEQIERLTVFSSIDAIDQKELAEEQLLSCQRNLASTIQKACEALFKRENPELLVLEYVRKGLLARRQRLSTTQVNGKPAKMKVDEVYLEIIKQVLPFEVCQYLPSVLLMTTNKFDTTTKRVQQRKRGDGIIFIDVPFDHLVGSKVKPEEPRISTISGSSHNEQIDFLRDEHFKLDPDCPFHSKEIRFTVVIDELHEAYVRLEDSCHVKLVSKENNLAHILSVTRRIYQEVKNLELREISEDKQTDFEKEGLKFINALRALLRDKCKLSPGTTLESFLDMFSDQLGAFEVNGDAAERIISITRNIFSFNAKMFVNEQALKRIRMRSTNGNLTRTELYYEIEGDTSDTNPNLHDLFQMVSAILAACSQITNRHYKRWVKNGGQDNASSQNSPLSQFVDAASNVASEVRHIFDRITEDDLEIDHFYTYMQPKTVFTLIPVADLNYVNKGAERTVILAFEMDLVKELPEAMLLRLLVGTNNKVVGLSATSGFTHTKNGNFNRNFLSRYAHDLGYQIVERQASDIDLLKQLREMRAMIRDVAFTCFDAELSSLTDTYQRRKDFREVYDEMFKTLQVELQSIIHNPYNPYKKLQFSRELEALLLAAYDCKNTLILSLSGEFKNAFAHAYRKNLTQWRKLYGMVSRCDDREAEKRHDRIFEFTPFKGRQKLRLVFFDAALASVTDVKAETLVNELDMSLVFMSTYNSAGTGLNYFVKYCDGNAGDTNAQRLDVDFQRLVLINSSFYSEVINGHTNLNTLSNYVSLLKHFADDNEIHLMRDLSVNFTQGENYRLLMAEHCMSLFKVIVQAVGRVERRDTRLSTEVFLPSDVMHSVSFQFASLSEKVGNSVVLASMSLLNYRLKEFCDSLSAKHSFAKETDRRAFEKQILEDGQRIDQVLNKILNKNWINQVRSGNVEFLEVCNLFRDIDSFANPTNWMEKLKRNPILAGNKQMMSIVDKMFISRRQGDDIILLCHKRGPDGLRAKHFGALSDFTGGALEYHPELMIFPQYTKNVDYTSGDIISRVLKHFKEIQRKSFADLVPHPAMIALLKGNAGEHMFDMIMEQYRVKAMTEDEVFQRLDPLVYEFFDRFIEVDNTLICIDVKNWATTLDNFELAEEMVNKSDRKISQLLELAEQKIDHHGEAQVRKTLAGRYHTIKFVYLNAAYSQNPNNLMWEENADHTVHYLNLFQSGYSYYRPRDREHNHLQDRFKLKNMLQVNPLLLSLLGIKANPAIGADRHFEEQ